MRLNADGLCGQDPIALHATGPRLGGTKVLVDHCAADARGARIGSLWK